LKIDLSKIDLENFVIKSEKVGGELCHLVTPNKAGTKWDKQNLIYRSSMWNSKGELISASFKKFFNHLESPDLYPNPEKHIFDWNIPEKIDGCCDGDTILLTGDGEKTIKEICETKYIGRVLSYCHPKQKQVFSKILSSSIQENNGDWYELELEDGGAIRLTGNHMVWLPSLQCYRRVDDLDGNEEILLKK
jgi:hypothetical protein